MLLYLDFEDIKSFTFMPLERFTYSSTYRNWFKYTFPSSEDPSLVINQKMEAKIYREKDSSFLPVWEFDHNGFNGEKIMLLFLILKPDQKEYRRSQI